MQLTIDPAFYFAASVRSLTTPFDMDEPQKMLEEKQLAAPAVAEGKYPEVQAGTGACGSAARSRWIGRRS